MHLYFLAFLLGENCLLSSFIKEKDCLLPGNEWQFLYIQEFLHVQVKTLVSLFRPIDLPPSISVVPIVANVAPAHAFPSAITVERVLPSARPYSLYLPGATHPRTLPGGWVQPSKHLHYVHQNTLPQSNQKYSAEAPQSTYDPQRRYDFYFDICICVKFYNQMT